MLLSIIIPMYNCAPVILRCLKSIDYPGAEILVIDDGSKDDSGQKVMEYATSHPNVTLVRKENGGVSSARNLGIDKATGKYLMFIDADDYLAPGGIGIALDMIQQYNADMLKYGYRFVRSDSPDNEPLDLKNSKCVVIDGRFAGLNRVDVPDYYVWNGIYLRELITHNDIRFHTDLCLHEDDVFMGEILCHTERIVTTDLPVYQYSIVSDYSSTHNQNIKRKRQLIESCYRAVHYRSEYVSKFYPEAMPLERLKYMRWVCHPQTAISAGYSYLEYKAILGRFKACHCWPLDYRWIHVAGLDINFKAKLKNVKKTFFCNHPWLAYLILGHGNKS